MSTMTLNIMETADRGRYRLEQMTGEQWRLNEGRGLLVCAHGVEVPVEDAGYADVIDLKYHVDRLHRREGRQSHR